MPLLLALLWSGAFFLSLPLVEPPEFARLGAVGLMVLAVLAAGWRWMGAEKRPPLFAPLPVLLLLFFLWAAASLFWTASVYHTTLGLGRLFLLPGSFLLLWLAGSPALYRYLAVGGGLIAGGLAVWALAQFFLFPEMLVRGQVRVPFANPNSLAALLALGFFPGLGVMVSGKTRALRNIALLFCALTLAAVIVIGGRGVLLASGVGLVLFLLLNRKELPAHGRCLEVLALVAITAFIAPYFTGGVVALERFADLADDPGFAASARTIIWEGTGDIIRDHFWLGIGFETFALYYPQYRLEADWFSGGFMAHSDPLQFWSELGVIGVGLFYVVLLLCGFYMLRAFVKKGLGGAEGAMVVAVFAGLLALILHSHISFNFYQSAHLVLSGALLGWWYQQVGPQGALTVKGGRGSVILYGVVFAAILTGLVFLQGVLLSGYYARKVQNYDLSAGLEAYATAANKAHELGFGLNSKPYLLAAAIPLTAMEGEGFLLPQEKRAELTAQAQSYIDQAQSRNPRDARIYYAQARLYRMQAAWEKAEKTLEEALVINPAHAPSRQMLGSLYTRKGREDKAWDVYQQGLNRAYVTDDPRAYFRAFLGLAEQRGDDVLAETIRQKLRRAEKRFGGEGR